MSMSVVLVASTVLHREALPKTPYKEHAFPNTTETVLSPDELTEFAARSVHGSWHRTDPNLATNSDYIQYLKERGDMSFFEHASASFWVEGVSLQFAADLRRLDSNLTISEASLRYRSLSGMSMVQPAATVSSPRIADDLESAFGFARGDGKRGESELKSRGYTHPAAREVALAYLLLCTETSMLVTGDMSTWPWVIEKALEWDSSPELFTFGCTVLSHLHRVAPNAVSGLAPMRSSRPAYDRAADEVLSDCG